MTGVVKSETARKQRIPLVTSLGISVLYLPTMRRSIQEVIPEPHVLDGYDNGKVDFSSCVLAISLTYGKHAGFQLHFHELDRAIYMETGLLQVHAFPQYAQAVQCLGDRKAFQHWRGHDEQILMPFQGCPLRCRWLHGQGFAVHGEAI